MFGIGFMEIVVIALFVLIFVGPQKLPALMRDIGRFMASVRRMSYEFRDGVEAAMNEAQHEATSAFQNIDELHNEAVAFPSKPTAKDNLKPTPVPQKGSEQIDS